VYLLLTFDEVEKFIAGREKFIAMQVTQSTMGADLRLGGVRPVRYPIRATAKDST